MKKKIVSVVLAMCTCFSLVACGGSNSGADTQDVDSTQPQETQCSA